MQMRCPPPADPSASNAERMAHSPLVGPDDEPVDRFPIYDRTVNDPLGSICGNVARVSPAFSFNCQCNPGMDRRGLETKYLGGTLCIYGIFWLLEITRRVSRVW